MTILSLIGHFSIAQSINWDLTGFTPPNEILILDQMEDAKGLKKGELIFSKAKGVFSFSPINTINHRALQKLKTEASLKGASHIYIDYRNIENSVFSKSAVYSARLYKQSNLSLNEVSKAIEGKKLILKIEKSYSRNFWKMNVTLLNDLIDFNIDAPLREENGKIFIDIRNRNDNFKEKKYEGKESYEVIAFEGNRMLVFKGDDLGTSNSLIGIEIQ